MNEYFNFKLLYMYMVFQNNKNPKIYFIGNQ